MKILIVGGGRAGAWQIRGVQLGAALGARVVEVPSDDDLRWADVVVLVKRAASSWAALVRRFHKPIVWDVLDFWKQPSEHGLSEKQSIALLRSHIAAIHPDVLVTATESMATLTDGVYLPHHARPGLVATDARVEVKTVGYEGNPLYLGRWKGLIQQECKRRGWTFTINPDDLTTCDLLVAFRDGIWDGWMPRTWKSGVKYVNAIAAGRPIVGHSSSAWQEVQPVGCIVERNDHHELSAAFDDWSRYTWRAACVLRCRARADEHSLSTVAERYRQILQTVRTSCLV